MIKLIERNHLFGLGILLPLVTQSTHDSFFPYEYIWLLFAAVNLFNMGYMYFFRVTSIVRENPQLEADSKVFMRWVFILTVIPFLLLYLVQKLGNFKNALYVFSNNYHNPYVVLGWSVFILFYIGIAYSILLGGGASMMIKFRRAFRSMPESETQIKIRTVITCLVSTVSLFVVIATNTFGRLHGS